MCRGHGCWGESSISGADSLPAREEPSFKGGGGLSCALINKQHHLTRALIIAESRGGQRSRKGVYCCHPVPQRTAELFNFPPRSPCGFGHLSGDTTETKVQNF